eukprot:1191249-Prorocentrum_minimum.AAC.1
MIVIGDEDLWLDQWPPTVFKNSSDAGELHTEGKQELYAMGRRFRSRFLELFSAAYSPQAYTFSATRKSRARQSAAAFALGVFEGGGPLGMCGMEPVLVCQVI